MSELRSPLDLPGIDSIEDLDGDVDGFDVHLDDLSPGNVVTIHPDDPEWAAKYVVTGRTDALDKSVDDTDIIEMAALDPSTSIVSLPASVASLHHRAARGEIRGRNRLARARNVASRSRTVPFSSALEVPHPRA